MFEEKPIRWSFIVSLPLIVAAIWAVFLVLAGFERRELVARLNDQIAQGGVEEATVALRQLARLSNPPLDTIVAAAASPSQAVAQEAQLAISNILRRWQRHLAAGRSTKQIANQLLRLAESLDRNRDAFSTNHYAWLAKTATRITRLANQAPLGGAAGLADHCDSLLAMADAPVPEPMRGASITVADALAAGEAAFDLGAASHAEQPPMASASVATAPPQELLSPPPHSALQLILPPGDFRRQDVDRDAKSTTASNGRGDGWQGHWRPPADKRHDVASTAPPSTGSDRSPATLPPSAFGSSTRPRREGDSAEATIDDRTLLSRWLESDSVAAASIERELAGRGFHSLPRDLVQRSLSDVVDDRVLIVHELLAMPGVDAKPWLALLADDAEADVRLAAVSVMATSNDPELIEKAWQVALHDRDPRVAGLAERLRARRASVRRR